MVYSLYDLNEHIRQVLVLNFRESVWITAEVSSSKHSRGHQFLDLIQKGDEGIVAMAPAVIWARGLQEIRREHGSGIHDLLKEGMELKLQVRVDFHERFGMKLIVEAIDPSYTLGKLALQKRLTIETLQGEGLLEANKKRILPPVIQRIAVLSSEDAAGLHDFKAQLLKNPYGYRFDIALFNTSVQGNLVEIELPSSLKSISRKKKQFDIAVLVRGGGARLDLAAFDSLILNRAIAEFPIPLLTGIGHEIDETVADLTAFAALKTPTAVAEYILRHNLLFENSVLELAGALVHIGSSLVQKESFELERINQSVFWNASGLLSKTNQSLDHLEETIPELASRQLSNAHKQLEVLESVCNNLDPEYLLAKGYAIVEKNNKQVRFAKDLDTGDELKIRLKDGSVMSKVTGKNSGDSE